MKKFSAGLVIIIALAAAIANAEELTLKTAEKYFAVINLKASMRHTIDLLNTQAINQMQFFYSREMKRKRMPDSDIKIALGVIRTNMLDIKNVMLHNLDTLLPVNQIIAEIYHPALKKSFSEEEVQELLNFYQTPLGKKVVTEMPEVMNESSKLLTQSPKYLPKVHKFLSAEIEKRNPVMKKEIDREIAKTRKKKKKTDE